MKCNSKTEELITNTFTKQNHDVKGKSCDKKCLNCLKKKVNIKNSMK